jgi:hypothetical protein
MLLQVGARRVALHELVDGKQDYGGNLQGICKNTCPRTLHINLQIRPGVLPIMARRAGLTGAFSM